MCKKKVAIAMSGGVDSSVTAYLLKHAGYDCFGVTMRLIKEGSLAYNKHTKLFTDKAEKDALRVASQLGIPHYVVDLSETFEKEVIEPFLSQYKEGKTPNPCVNCNQMLKFGSLWSEAVALGADYIATGHYVRIGYEDKWRRYTIRRGKDRKKDQSYFLYGLNQDQLSHILTPLGEYTKEEVRKIAKEFGLDTAEKPESQEICFIPFGDYRSFLQSIYGPQRPGPIVDTSGKILGEHKGLTNYTIGQRKGLGALGLPKYVIALDKENNTLIVGSEEEAKGQVVMADAVNWVALKNLDRPHSVLAQIRHKATPALATIQSIQDGRIKTVFATPQWGITPGQKVVWYERDTVLGGATII